MDSDPHYSNPVPDTIGTGYPEPDPGTADPDLGTEDPDLATEDSNPDLFKSNIRTWFLEL